MSINQVMTNLKFIHRLHKLFRIPIVVDGNFVLNSNESQHVNQQQVNDVFSEKWEQFDKSEEKERAYSFQRNWYLQLYGFASEDELRDHLLKCDVVFDAGCGLGYKAAWFATLAPETLIIGMDFSDAARQAAINYAKLPNLFFVQGDIAKTGIRDGGVAFASCDQVIMHTEDPEITFSELARITYRNGGQVACYFYAKKALPRELLDDHFRIACSQLSGDELWAMAAQLTELGRRLTELNISLDVPDIPALGIKGGIYDIQRFVYWNFIKCFWNAELGRETSLSTNYDWYSPSNARRFSEGEVRKIISANNMSDIFFHIEEACYSGRFSHQHR